MGVVKFPGETEEAAREPGRQPWQPCGRQPPGTVTLRTLVEKFADAGGQGVLRAKMAKATVRLPQRKRCKITRALLKPQDHPTYDLWRSHLSSIVSQQDGCVEGDWWNWGSRKRACKVTMTALWAATTQTSLQVLREKNQGPGTRGFTGPGSPKGIKHQPQAPSQ